MDRYKQVTKAFANLPTVARCSSASVEMRRGGKTQRVDGTVLDTVWQVGG